VATRSSGQNDAALVFPALKEIDAIGLEGCQDVLEEANLTGSIEK